MHHHYLDRFAQGDSPVHRLDARAKLLAVLAYTVVLLSFERHALAKLAPMTLLPAAMLWFARVPVWFALRRVLLLSPFLLMLALAAALHEQTPLPAALGPWRWRVAGGHLTAASVTARFALSVAALTALMSTTPFSLLLEAMRRLRMPRMLVMQLGMLYRYVFVLVDEAMRMRRARDFRLARRAPTGRRLAAAGGVVGTLLLRTLQRGERIHTAMTARGWRGEPHGLRRLSLDRADGIFLAAVAVYLPACRWLYPALVSGN